MRKQSKRRKMKVLVTGATGFLGKYIVEELSREGYEVIAFGRNEKKGRELTVKYPKTYFMKGDFENRTDLEKINHIEEDGKNIDFVIHAGGLSTVWGRWNDFYSANVKGTENIIDFCRQSGNIQKLVFVSSPSIYAKAEDGLFIKEEEAPTENNLNFYIKSKLIAENRIKKSSDIPWVIIRPRGLFGIGDTSIIPRLLNLNNRIGIPLFSKGEQMVDVTCVENVALSIRIAMEKEAAAGGIYNITNDEPMKFKDILDLFFKEMNIEGKYVNLNYKITKFIVTIMEKVYSILRIRKEPPLTLYTLYLLKYSQTLSVKKAKKELGYSPKMTVKEGVIKYVKHNKH